MNYRHLYHAGNFADVFKHLVLIKLLEKLRSKETNFCVLDTHAGIGMYDLLSETAEKTGEYRQGIVRLLEAPALPEAFTPYLQAVKSVNDEILRYYPGSPCITQQLLRTGDRLLLAELHPEDAHRLKGYFSRDKQVSVHHMDGYLSMKAFLPPKEKRGLVLIDPPFEQVNEFETIVEAVKMAHQRFHHGIYAIWYPIKDRLPITYFYRSLLATGIPKIMVLELLIRPDDTASRLNGCGMIIINAPWKLDEEAALWLPELTLLLAEEGKGSSRVEWLRE